MQILNAFIQAPQTSGITENPSEGMYKNTDGNYYRDNTTCYFVFRAGALKNLATQTSNPIIGGGVNVGVDYSQLESTQYILIFTSDPLYRSSSSVVDTTVYVQYSYSFVFDSIGDVIRALRSGNIDGASVTGTGFGWTMAKCTKGIFTNAIWKTGWRGTSFEDKNDVVSNPAIYTEGAYYSSADILGYVVVTGSVTTYYWCYLPTRRLV